MKATAVRKARLSNWGESKSIEGFKQSAAGLIPSDWSCLEINDVADILTGFPFPSTHYTTYGIRLLRGSNVKRGNIEWSEGLVSYWPEVSGWIKKYLLKAGDIVIAMDGSLVGKSFAVLSRIDVPSLLVQRVACLRSRKVTQDYLGYWICSSRFTSHCENKKTNTAVPHISPQDISSFKIAVPSSQKEQERIAKTLGDIDALIDSLERLIEKKRLIKQGAMQDLLSGRKRLPGFSGEWEFKRLGGVVDIDPENLGNQTSLGFTFKYISLENVREGVLRGNAEHDFGSAPSRARKKLRKYDVLIGTVRPNLKSHYLFRKDEDDWVCSTGFCVLRCRQSVLCPEYIYNQFFADQINQQIYSLIAGSNYPAISSRDIGELEVLVPPYEEQVAISSVITDMEGEISLLAGKLDQARQIKQGMMQELLTGRVRLV